MNPPHGRYDFTEEGEELSPNSQTACNNWFKRHQDFFREDIPSQRETVLPDVPSVRPPSRRGDREDSLDTFWKREGYRRVRLRPGETSGRKRSPARVSETERAFKRTKCELLRPRPVSRQLPIGEEQGEGSSVLHQGEQLHRSASDSAEEEEDGGHGMECSEDPSEGGEDSGSDGGVGEGREVGEGLDALWNNNSPVFQWFSPDLRTQYNATTERLSEPVRVGSIDPFNTQGTDRDRQDNTGLLAAAEGAIRESCRSIDSVRPDEAPWDHHGRHELQALAGREPDPSCGYCDGAWYTRKVQGRYHTCRYGAYHNDEQGRPRGPEPGEPGYCAPCYYGTFLGLRQGP